MTEAQRMLVSFARALRDEGLSGAPDRTIAFCEATALLSPEDLYWAGRTTLVSRPRDISTYDDVFVRFFGFPPQLALSRPPAVSIHR
ncbi:MAG TPA: hypothetical protein VI296_07860, partial [Candidatus Dormibacteraeota bacterium]